MKKPVSAMIMWGLACVLGEGLRINERIGTPMSRLRSPPETLSLALNVRTEGLGLRATGRILSKSHATISAGSGGWHRKLSPGHRPLRPVPM